MIFNSENENLIGFRPLLVKKFDYGFLRGKKTKKSIFNIFVSSNF